MFVQIGTTGENATFFRNSGLACNTTYFYRVKAVRGGGSTLYSNVAGATTRPCATPTRTVTPIRTPTRTATPLRTATRTATPLRTATRTATPLRTATRTATPLRTPTRTPTAAPTPALGGTQPALVGFVPGLGVGRVVDRRRRAVQEGAGLAAVGHQKACRFGVHRQVHVPVVALGDREVEGLHLLAAHRTRAVRGDDEVEGPFGDPPTGHEGLGQLRHFG